ncbi:MAG TPA: diguanylate cyclase [Solirubrobacteraceae bacterium]|nr:diguanylate cyclase [Solirubrobacteraceae bacterium]
MTTPLLVQDDHTIELAAESLLREHPEALVCGLSTNGLIVPIPQSVALRGQATIEGRAVIDSVVGADRNTVVDLWQRVQREGSVRGMVRLLSKPSRWVTVYFLDLRHVHEILLCAIIPGEQAAEDEDGQADELPPAAPRFCSLTEDELGKVLGCDAAFVQMFGYTAQEVIGQSVLDQIHPEDQGRVVEGWLAMLATHRDQQTRLRRKRKDGSWMWVDTTVHNFLNEPARNHVLVEIIDVSAEMVAQEALQEREELLRRLIDAMPDGLLQSDTDRNVIYHNARLAQILQGTPDAGSDGLRSPEAVDTDKGDHLVLSANSLLSTLTEEAASVFEAALGRVLDEGIDQNVEVDFVLPSGRRRRALMSVRALLRQSGEVSGAITSVCDVTDSTRARNELERRASFDALTGAHNRPSILGALQSELERDDAAKTGVIYVDLDGFKAVNDTLGHAAGDELLVLIAERLKEVGRGDDAVGRLGGDEFLMLLRDVPGPEVAMNVARRISESVGSVFTLSCGPVELRASLGVAYAEAHTITAEELVERADSAMYRSKYQGHGLPILAGDAV